MTSIDRNIVENHIKEIIRLSVSVTVVINNGPPISNCKFLTRANGRTPMLRLPVGNYPDRGRVHVSCTHLNMLYTFNASIVAIEKTNSRYAYIHISLPETMTKQDRRRFSRAKPAGSKPVRVRFMLHDKTTITVEATDISGGGFACVLPVNLSSFQVSDSFPVAITFPVFGRIQTWATVTSVSRTSRMNKIAFAYSLMTEHAHSIVTSYVTTRQREFVPKSVRNSKGSTRPV